jgi:tetratricopeptide (TPR) repeat protein
MIPHYLDYEEGNHLVNFRNVKGGTRKDITFHYAHIVPVFGDVVDERGVLQQIGQDITGQVTKVDNVSFFTTEKNGISEHRIYQIGARYEANELTADDTFGLGQLYYDSENYDKAIEYYTKVLKIEPNDPDTISCLGLAFACNSNPKEAISLYNKALDMYPEDSMIWDCLSFAYECNNENEKALEACQKALELNPTDEEIQKHLDEIKEIINESEH